MFAKNLETKKAEKEVEKFYTFLIFLFIFNFLLVLSFLFFAGIYLKLIPLNFLIIYFLIVVFALIFLPKTIYKFFYSKQKNKGK